ncbi:MULTISPECIES: hypothetical protein [unclassified Amycolatopsis]|uniref:hypothetical protein n=1 Tax=unclassified Amycolatopsis TaxID=2618356 RepID=UPI001EE92595|nr:hypothetical protein [Amycolatopsis sp. Poz14]MCG3752281.1 hypothetical protein [Amycolatopsis sp. Poz14]
MASPGSSLRLSRCSSQQFPARRLPFSRNDVERLVVETIEDGLDDWVSLDWLITNTARVVPEDSDRFARFFAAVLGYLLRKGLMVVGEIGDTGIEPWPPAAVEDDRGPRRSRLPSSQLDTPARAVLARQDAGRGEPPAELGSATRSWWG